MATGLTSKGAENKNKNKKSEPFAHSREISEQEHKQFFNMCEYAAPKLETVRIGIIGIGRRCIEAVHRLKLIEWVEIKALCDIRMDRVDEAQKAITDFGLPAARTYGKSEDAWIRRKLRCYRIKQCKRTITLQRFLESMGVKKWQSWILALSGKGLWRKSKCPKVNQAMGNQWFEEQGLYNLALNYKRLTNLKKPPCTKVCPVV